MSMSLKCGLFALGLLGSSLLPAATPEPRPPTMAEVLAASTAEDWRRPDPLSTLYLELASGRVVIELAPAFAPRHVANLRLLTRQQYFDGLAIVRSQENYVVQWGDPAAGTPEARDFGKAARSLPAEILRPAKGLSFAQLPDVDGYARQVGFAEGFWAARSAADGEAWMAHCYSTVGVGRDMDLDSGSGAELYVVIGHAPRHLDRNITVIGRVLWGMEHLSTLPRGSGALGFYEQAEQRVPIRRVRLAADVPTAERSALEVMRTDTARFEQLVEARRNRRDEWYKVPAGHVELCNVPIPVRPAQP